MTPQEQWAWIETTASNMGATAAAIQKWRERGYVPFKWRYALSECAKLSKRKIDHRIFVSPPARENGK